MPDDHQQDQPEHASQRGEQRPGRAGVRATRRRPAVRRGSGHRSAPDVDDAASRQRALELEPDRVALGAVADQRHHRRRAAPAPSACSSTHPRAPVARPRAVTRGRSRARRRRSSVAGGRRSASAGRRRSCRAGSRSGSAVPRAWPRRRLRARPIIAAGGLPSSLGGSRPRPARPRPGGSFWLGDRRRVVGRGGRQAGPGGEHEPAIVAAGREDGRLPRRSIMATAIVRSCARTQFACAADGPGIARAADQLIGFGGARGRHHALRARLPRVRTTSSRPPLRSGCGSAPAGRRLRVAGEPIVAARASAASTVRRWRRPGAAPWCCLAVGAAVRQVCEPRRVGSTAGRARSLVLGGFAGTAGRVTPTSA